MASTYERRQEGVQDEDKKKVSKEGLREMLQIYKFVMPYKGYFLTGLSFLFLSILTGNSFPLLIGGITGTAIGEKGTVYDKLIPIQEFFGVGQLNALAIVLGFVVLIQGFFSFFRIYLFAQVSERAIADIRYTVYRKIITMPVTFFESRRIGELNSRISSDITQLQDMLSVTVAEFIRQILTLTIGITIMFIMSWKLTLFMLATFPVLVVATLVFGRFIRKISKNAQDELAQASVVVEETFQAFQIVKAFTNELREVMRYRSALDKGLKSTLTVATYRSFFTTFVICAIFGGIILVVWYGGTMVQSGEINFSQLLSFILYTVFIGTAVGGLGELYSQLQKTIGSSQRVREILRETPEFELQEKVVKAARFEGEITYKNVEFSYPARPEIQVLKGTNLAISAGQTIGLVGHSGAGKSTITQLLMRFYEHNEGEILIDGKPINSYDLTTLRQNIGIVPQEVILFGGTIRENIAYGKLDATESEILDAAKRANAMEFISRIPEGLDTVVGERGIKLSGGQRQRIAIARAILKNPAILILDEATSSLDAESESLVQEALNELMKGRTTLIIAHRLSTIRNADNIYVLDGGKVAESGTHEELVNIESGIYQSLVRLQTEYANAQF